MAVVWHKRAALSWFVGHAHKLLSLESPETLLRAQPYISTDVLSPRHTGAHLLKLDIIWIATVHWTQNTFNEPEFLWCRFGLWLIWTLNMLLFAPLSRLEIICLGVRYWMCCETYFYMFLSWYLQKPGHALNYYFMKWHEVSLRHMGHLSSSGSMTDTGPLNTVNTLSKHIHTTNTLLIQRYTP